MDFLRREANLLVKLMANSVSRENCEKAYFFSFLSLFNLTYLHLEHSFSRKNHHVTPRDVVTS